MPPARQISITMPTRCAIISFRNFSPPKKGLLAATVSGASGPNTPVRMSAGRQTDRRRARLGLNQRLKGDSGFARHSHRAQSSQIGSGSQQRFAALAHAIRRRDAATRAARSQEGAATLWNSGAEALPRVPAKGQTKTPARLAPAGTTSRNSLSSRQPEIESAFPG